MSTGNSIRDEWSRLEHVVIGRADSLTVPRSALAVAQGSGLTESDYRRANQLVRARCGFEQGRLVHLLRKRGVRVSQPEPLPGPQAESTFGQLFVRDTAIIVAQRCLAALAMSPMRQAEQSALAVAVGELLRLPGPEQGYLDGGDVLVDWPRVYVGLGGHRSNRAGLQWLQACLPAGMQIVGVPFSTKEPTHLDCCLALTGPGRGIVYPGAFPNGLPPPISNYALIEVDHQTFAELGVNVLSIDPSTLVMQRRHESLQRVLQSNGIVPLTIDFEQHVALGGGIRCASLALKRASAAQPD